MGSTSWAIRRWTASRSKVPYTATGSGDTPSRRKIFVCQPAGPADEAACATRILSSLARVAYRRPVDKTTVDTLMDFYRRGRAGVTGSSAFDRGIEICASVHSRKSGVPDALRDRSAEPCVERTRVIRLDDLALASRLSFFLWSSLPDDQLLTLASQGKLKDPVVLEQQVKRMLADSTIRRRSSPTSPSNGCTCEISRTPLRIWKRSPISTTTFASP